MELSFNALAVLFVITTSLQSNEGCLPEIGKEYPMYSMEETFQLAPVVVYGYDVFHNNTDNTVDFEVYCVFKSDNRNISANVTLIDAAVRVDCSGTHLSEEVEYILTLTPVSSDGTRFSIFEPESIFTTGEFRPTNANLQRAADVCGNGTIPDSIQADDKPCPAQIEQWTGGSGTPFLSSMLLCFHCIIVAILKTTMD